MKIQNKQRAFTLGELTVSMGLLGLFGIALLTFGYSSSRFVSRNLATNRSHDAVRICSETLLRELRQTGSSFRLVNFNGTTYVDATPAATGDQDTQTNEYASTRSNGVRFRRPIGGPYQLTADCIPSATSLTFNFRTGITGESANYIPEAGDKLVLPLISREYDITAVSGTPSAGSPTVTVTLSPAIGFTLSSTSPKFITGQFYRRSAFTVWNNELRYHKNFNPSSQNSFRVVRTNITSPLPFALLYETSGSALTDSLSMRVSLEITDLDSSAQRFGNNTTTLRAVIPARNQPTPVASTN